MNKLFNALVILIGVAIIAFGSALLKDEYGVGLLVSGLGGIVTGSAVWPLLFGGQDRD